VYVPVASSLSGTVVTLQGGTEQVNACPNKQHSFESSLFSGLVFPFKLNVLSLSLLFNDLTFSKPLKVQLGTRKRPSKENLSVISTKPKVPKTIKNFVV
jgi:hypothetical protein